MHRGPREDRLRRHLRQLQVDQEALVDQWVQADPADQEVRTSHQSKVSAGPREREDPEDQGDPDQEIQEDREAQEGHLKEHQEPEHQTLESPNSILEEESQYTLHDASRKQP